MPDQLKILLCGEGNVGKTSLIHRYVKGTFEGTYKATIGVDLFQKLIKIDEEEVSLQIWDLAGQSVFQKIRPRFFAKANGALFAFDLTMPSSFQNLNTWISDLRESEGLVPTILLGNKMDLLDMKAVSDEEITAFVENKSEVKGYFETSAKTGYNVNNAFHKLVEIIYEKSL